MSPSDPEREARHPNCDRPTELWECPKGRLAISHPAPGVIVFTYDGRVTADAVPFIEQSVNRVLSCGVVPDLFIDLERMKGYDSEYRRAISRWGAKNYLRFGEVSVFVRSRLVAMGIAVSNLTAAGKLQPTANRAHFQAALDRAIARHRSASD